MEELNKRFRVVEGEKKGLRVISIIDPDYQKYPQKHLYPWFLWINIELKDLRPDQLPTIDEDRALDSLEDQIEREVHKLTKIYFVGRLTSNGLRELYFYLEDAKIADEILNKIIKKPLRPFKYRIERDENWEKVNEFFGGRLPFNKQ